VGPMVHDARVAAICLQDAIEELWTVARASWRFPALRVRNPLVSERLAVQVLGSSGQESSHRGSRQEATPGDLLPGRTKRLSDSP
jgi:hypothetical protein